MGEKNNPSYDTNSIEDIYHEFSLPIYRYLLRLSGSEQSARDMTQETFYQAIKSLHRFRGDSKVSTWLYKIARNIYLKYERSRKREEDKGQVLSYEIKTFDEAKAPEELLIQKEIKEEINIVLKLLPEPYRTVLILKEVEGLSHGKIAEILDKSIPSTKVLLYRAKEKFKNRYSRMGGR